MSSWVDALPEVLVFKAEPDLVVGDQIVFKHREVTIPVGDLEWAEKHQGEDGLRVPEKPTDRVPDEYLEITHVGRHKRGHWFARFIVRGADKVEYLAPSSGTTTNPRRSIDEEAPVLRVVDDPQAERRNMDLRERQRLVNTKRAQLEQLAASTSNAEMMRLTLSISDLERKIEAIDQAEDKKAA